MVRIDATEAVASLYGGGIDSAVSTGICGAALHAYCEPVQNRNPTLVGSKII